MNKPDIVEIIEREGYELRRKGQVLFCHCPFHAEKTASFAVYPEKQRFVCFGCGKKGDVLDFIMGLKDFSFKDALDYLKVQRDPKNRDAWREKRKRELLHDFEAWCTRQQTELADLLRFLDGAIDLAHWGKDVEAAGKLASIKEQEQYTWDVLQGNDDALKFELYRKAREFGE